MDITDDLHKVFSGTRYVINISLNIENCADELTVIWCSVGRAPAWLIATIRHSNTATGNPNERRFRIYDAIYRKLKVNLNLFSIVDWNLQIASPFCASSSGWIFWVLQANGKVQPGDRVNYPHELVDFIRRVAPGGKGQDVGCQVIVLVNLCVVLLILQ